MLTQRLVARVRRDFQPAGVDAVVGRLEGLTLPFLEGDDEGTERVRAAVVLLADGDLRRLDEAAALAEQDWRDVLVAAGLANEDWRERLAAALGGR